MSKFDKQDYVNVPSWVRKTDSGIEYHWSFARHEDLTTISKYADKVHVDNYNSYWLHKDWQGFHVEYEFYDIDNPTKDTYPDIYYGPANSKRYGKVEYWQDVKIREILKNLYGSNGMPSKFMFGMDFVHKTSLDIPMGFEIRDWMTSFHWILHPERAWREIIIKRAPIEDAPVDLNSIMPKLFQNKGIDLIWHVFTDQFYPVYENLSFLNTINPVLILANWDKIRQDINRT